MNSTQENFINSIKAGAIQGDINFGICASITISQAILESGWGSSGLTQKANNLFGVKCFDNSPYVEMKTAEYRNGEKYFTLAKFKKYKSLNESVVDHARFLVDNPRYKKGGLFNTRDYKEQAKILQQCGYATSPIYANQLIEIIEMYNLQKYDRKEGKEMGVNYTLEFQKWFNKITQTGKPITEDGLWGEETQKAFILMGELIKKKY